MDFRILGPLEVHDGGRALRLGGERQRTLLAVLLTRANEVVSADRLVDELWGAHPPAAAANALQYHVSQLRKAFAPAEVLITREPGYLIRVEPGELDLFRFERLVDDAQRAPPELAARLLREALDLWRGPPLSDLGSESAHWPEARRLEELRLEALERRIDSDLALGRGAQLVGELEVLVREHPFRERLRAGLMRALYRAGRQAEALEAYRQMRATLVDELGIEPGPALQELERAILRHDPALSPSEGVATGAAPARRGLGAIMVVAAEGEPLDGLLALAEPLARRPAREVILLRLLQSQAGLGAAADALAAARRALGERGVTCRVAAYTTADPAGDAALLAGQIDVDLILMTAPAALLESGWPEDRLAAILLRASCDVGMVVGGPPAATGPIVTPFGGAEHDWSAIEVAAWLAGSVGTTLRLLGTEADPALGRRDASRLLGRASLLVQQVIGIDTEPVLVRAGEDGVLAAARDARMLVVGLSDRWRTEGIGSARLAVAAGSDAPTLFVRRGLKPGGVAPSETLTRFTWSLGS